MKLKKLAYSLFLIILLVMGYYFLSLEDSPQPIAEPMQTGFYVWQRAWTPAVQSAITQSQELSDGYWLTAGTVNPDWQSLNTHLEESDWKFIKTLHKPITLVYRIHHNPKRWLSNNEYEFMNHLLIQPVMSIIHHAREQGINITGLQIDYDCPTSKLSFYTDWMAKLHDDIEGVELSITALPTWMTSRYWKKLVKQTDYYVLQIHSFEIPAQNGQLKPVFDDKNYPNYMQTAHETRHPFFLSLPTYGYRVYFDQDGQYLRISAEGFTPLLQKGYSVKAVMADAESLANVVKSLKDNRPPYCRGVLWFRLPVEADELNWSYEALQAVMQGEIPSLQFHAEIKTINPQLAEIWIHNTGEQHTPNQIALQLEINPDAVLAYDMMSGYQTVDGIQHITGNAPKQDQPILAAWIRLKEDYTLDTSPIQTKKIEVLP